MTKFFEELIKATENDDASIVENGVPTADLTGFIDSGSYALNALMSGSIYGGYPGNRVTALGGESSTGKTFAVLTSIKTFLDSYKDSFVAFFESESAVTKKMCEERGIDISRMAIIPITTIEQFKFQATKLLNAYKEKRKEGKNQLMIVLDSLGMLSTSKEMSDATEGKDSRDMTKAQQVKSAFRVLTIKAATLGVPMLVTNHLYAAIGGYMPSKELSGGEGLRYAASTILIMTKAKDKDASGAITGNIVTVKLYKGRFTKENKTIKTLIDFNKGLDRYAGLLDIAEKYELVKKVGNKYEFSDGTKAFEKEIKNNPTKYYTKELLDQIDVACKKEFCYGTGDEIAEDVIDDDE